eukprot:5590640-Prymnesium_polylepis.2
MLDHIARLVLEVLVRSARLIELRGEVCRVTGWRHEVRVVFELHLSAHVDRLVGGARIDVARLGGGHHQPRHVLHKIEPRRVCACLPLEDEQADKDAEVLAVPEAGRQLRVARHLAERLEQARLDRGTHL